MGGSANHDESVLLRRLLVKQVVGARARSSEAVQDEAHGSVQVGRMQRPWNIAAKRCHVV